MAARKQSRELATLELALDPSEKAVQEAKAYFDQVFDFFIKTTQVKVDKQGLVTKAERMLQKASKKLSGFIYSLCDGESKSMIEDKPTKKKGPTDVMSVSDDEDSTVNGHVESDQATGDPSETESNLEVSDSFGAVGRFF